MLPTSSLDQALFLTPVELKLLDKVDSVIDAAVKTEDDTQIKNLSKTIQRTGHVCALAQAKLMYRWKEEFTKFNIGEDFVDYIASEIGLSIQTVVKYIKVWEWIFANEDVPDNLKPRLLNVPIQTLILVAPAASEGELNKEDWQHITDAPDRASVHDIIRVKRGQVSSSKTSLKIVCKRDGTLVALKEGSEPTNFGFLSPDVVDPLAKSAIERIMRCSGILRQ